MRHFSLFILLSLVVNCLQAQLTRGRYHNEDSLRMIIEGTPNDTTRINLLLQLASSYFFKQPDSSLLYAMQALEISDSLKSTKYYIRSVSRLGESIRLSGDLSSSMKMHLEALELSQKFGDSYMEAESYGFIGLTYLAMESYDNAFKYLRKAIVSHQKLRHDGGSERLFMVYMARVYNETHKLDSSFYILAKAKEIRQRSQASQLPINLANTLGHAFLLDKNLDSANFYYRLGLRLAPKEQKFRPNYVSQASVGLGTVFMEKNLVDSALYFARYAYSIVRNKKLPRSILDASSLLAQLHRKTGELDSALYYLDITIALNDSIYGKDQFNRLHLLLSEEQKRVQEVQRDEEHRRSTQVLVGLVSITAVILIGSILLFRSNRLKQKTNLVLQQALRELKATQSQLVQSEKMASLGELTAGIAHEIQNPLNFVNNFSEVNKELIQELTQQAREGNLEEVQKLASDIKGNEDKIEQHGKKADAIVKSMLQHSRVSSGKKELTDINKLCDEYTRLAYHGYRARDKSFNAIPINIAMETDFDPRISPIQAIPQDIGRVILNLINNAFYTVSEKDRTLPDGYTPVVSISTKRLGDKIDIRVKDNGKGIEDAIKKKIFQPFFTTKPTGQGTGLGLSLSYDIIKAHGGTLEVNSSQEGGSEFIILLPSKPE